VTVASEDEGSKGTSRGRGRSATAGGTRVPWVVGAAFIVLALGIGLAIGEKSTNPPPAPGSRAILVPNADQPLRVVVPPCGTKLRVSAQNVPEQLKTQGVTTVVMPKAEGRRVLVVPKCPGPTASIPSAIYVLKRGSPTPTEKSDVGGLGSVRSLLIVPEGSALSTIVVAPCDRGGASVRKSVILTSRGIPPTDTAAAPRC
jgi:hypothetical protein